MNQIATIEADFPRLWKALSGRNRAAFAGLVRGDLDSVVWLLRSQTEVPHPFVIKALRACLDPSLKTPVSFVVATGKRGSPPRALKRDIQAIVAELAIPNFDRASVADRLSRLPLKARRSGRGRPAGTRTLTPLATFWAHQWVGDLVAAGKAVGSAREQVADKMKVGVKLLEMRLGENAK